MNQLNLTKSNKDSNGDEKNSRESWCRKIDLRETGH